MRSVGYVIITDNIVYYDYILCSVGYAISVFVFAQLDSLPMIQDLFGWNTMLVDIVSHQKWLILSADSGLRKWTIFPFLKSVHLKSFTMIYRRQMINSKFDPIPAKATKNPKTKIWQRPRTAISTWKRFDFYTMTVHYKMINSVSCPIRGDGTFSPNFLPHDPHAETIEMMLIKFWGLSHNGRHLPVRKANKPHLVLVAQ